MKWLKIKKMNQDLFKCGFLTFNCMGKWRWRSWALLKNVLRKQRGRTIFYVSTEEFVSTENQKKLKKIGVKEWIQSWQVTCQVITSDISSHIKWLVKSYQVISSHIKSYQVISSDNKSYQVITSDIKSYQVISSHIEEAILESDRLYRRDFFDSSHRILFLSTII
jgi:hypothetical protein